MSELNERILIASFSVPENIALVFGKRKVKSEDFLFHRDKVEFILNFYKKYQRLPTPQVVVNEFPAYEPTSIDLENIDYFIDQLKKDSMERKISDKIEKEIPIIRSNPAQALRDLSDFASRLLQSVDTDVSHTDRDAYSRLAKYEERRLWYGKGAVAGIPTGFRYFSDKREGFNYGNLVTLIGHTWIGKSWMLLHSAICAYLAGERVLLFSCEMTGEEEELRFDTMLAAKKQIELPFTDLRIGAGDHVETYEKFLRDLSETDNWITADSSDVSNLTLDEISTLIDAHQPTVLAIDGLEYLRDPRAKERSGWEETKAIIQEAKRLATSRKILVLCTAQTRRIDEDRMPKMKDIAFAFDIVRASDYVLAFSRLADDDPDADTMRCYTVQKERNGQGHKKRIKFKFNPNVGEIHEVWGSDDTDRKVAQGVGAGR